MQLNEAGETVAECWDHLADHFAHIELDAFIVIAPAIKHGLPAGSLCAVVRNFKSVSTRKINENRDARGAPVWQRNDYEHIIRNEKELDRIRAYIAGNPAKWDEDVDKLLTLGDPRGQREWPAYLALSRLSQEGRNRGIDS